MGPNLRTAMAKNLGDLFVKSVVRQVGRDTGKVISNKVFKDAHSTPIRIVSPDTSPQFSGTRRKYRHELDRVVNGDLPSTKGKAKKQIVALENAYEEFVGSMRFSNMEGLVAFRNWSNKSLDYLDDVVKIVSDEGVVELAEGVRSTISKMKESAVDVVHSIQLPSEEDQLKPRKRARTIFGLGVVSIALLACSSAALGDDEGGMLSTLRGILMLCSTVFLIWGIAALRKSSRDRRNAEEIGETLAAMKSEVQSW